MNKNAILAGVLVLVVFLLGLLTGFLLPDPPFMQQKEHQHTEFRRGEGPPDFASERRDSMQRRVLEGLVDRLSLEESQRMAFTEVLKDHRQRTQEMMQAHRRSSRVQMDSLRKELDLDLAEILTEEQMQRWQKVRKRMENIPRRP